MLHETMNLLPLDHSRQMYRCEKLQAELLFVFYETDRTL